MLQSFSGLASYFCSDCKKHYDSASSLLNHFAQHITQNDACQTSNSDVSEDTDSKQNCSFLTYDHKKRKNASILEKVLKQALSSLSPRTDPSSPASSSTSEYNTSSSDNDNCHSEQDSEIPLPVMEFEKQKLHCTEPASNVMLVKFDLQTRLENCILKLSAKRDSKMEPLTRSSVLNISQDRPTWESSGLPVINSPDLTVTMSPNTNIIEPEEFNPLKFCVVTMEEGDDKLDLDIGTSKICLEEMSQNASSSKGSSNRKQQVPKKLIFDGKPTQDETVNVLKDKISTKKKYPCLVCCKVFGWSTDLKRHILTHTGERPFKCLQCPATFTRNFLLQKHELKQHPSSSRSGASNESQTSVQENTIKPPTIDDVETASGKEIKALHSERKRKLQRTMSGQFDSNIIEKRLELHQCSPINIGIFSQQALNIL